MSNFITATCPICNRTEAIELYPIKYSSNKVLEKLALGEIPEVTLKKCVACRHHYASHQISDAMLEKYYSKLNSEYYDNISSGQNHLAQYNSKLVKIIENFIQKGKILEIGCGFGHLLNSFNKKMWERHGVEPSPKAAAFASELLSLAVINSRFGPDLYESSYFDVILLTDVIEHLNNPVEVFNQIHRILAPSGFLIIVTGNIKSLSARFFKQRWGYFCSWEHINFYSPASLTSLFLRTGFTLLELHKIPHSGSVINDGIQLYHSVFDLVKNAARSVLKGHSPGYLPSNSFLFWDHMLAISQKL